MSLLKIVTILAPLIVRGSVVRSSKAVLHVAMASFLALLGGIALLSAGFVFVLKTTSLIIAFLALAAVFFVPSGLIILRLKMKAGRKPKAVAKTMTNDPLADKIPDVLANNPSFQSIVAQINDNPVPATAAALALGMVFANEVFGD